MPFPLGTEVSKKSEIKSVNTAVHTVQNTQAGSTSSAHSLTEKKHLPKKAAAPLGSDGVKRASSTSIDLFSQLLEQEQKKEEEEKETIDTQNLPKNHFAESDVQEFWQQFLSELKQKEFFIYNAICDFKINKLDENTLKIQYPSETAKTEFDKISPQFFSEFKHKVNHFSVEAQFEINHRMKKEKITRRKIFEQLAEKNPLLNELNSIFNFDLTD